MTRQDIEIMAPVGSYEALMAAMDAGADSVYFGVEGLNMRARSAANFTLDDLAEIVRRARERGVKTYLTVNTVIYDEETELMRRVIDRAVAEGVSAIIASDQAAILYARSVGMEVHISTQLNVSNSETLRFYSQWADVVVLARELSLPQIAHIHAEIERGDIRGPRGELVRLEMFAHGALCMAVSGKCYLSLHENGNSANRGACMQICRRGYLLSDAETGHEIEVENRRLLSPKDLCTLPFLDRMIGAGVRVLKIEGRARSAEYVKRVVEVYGEAVEAIAADSKVSGLEAADSEAADSAEGSQPKKFTPEWVEGAVGRLSEVFNRGFWGGYYLGMPVPELTRSYGSSATRRKVYVGRVTNFFKRISVAEVLVEASPLETGAEVVVMGETTGVAEIASVEVFVADRPASEAVQGVTCSIKTDREVRRGDKLYKIVEN
ncbi:MAG: U32 family peptidase [Alistipes sp.]|jgi:putative protease|nr:U32 family peptidase [Alistipes sp.]